MASVNLHSSTTKIVGRNTKCLRLLSLQSFFGRRNFYVEVVGQVNSILSHMGLHFDIPKWSDHELWLANFMSVFRFCSDADKSCALLSSTSVHNSLLTYYYTLTFCYFYLTLIFWKILSKKICGCVVMIINFSS